jgi:hypothetical protein
LAEIRDALIERGIQPGSLTTTWWTLRRLGLTHKKALHAAEQERPDVAEHRRVWQRYMDAASFVFIVPLVLLPRSSSVLDGPMTGEVFRAYVE